MEDTQNAFLAHMQMNMNLNDSLWKTCIDITRHSIKLKQPRAPSADLQNHIYKNWFHRLLQN